MTRQEEYDGIRAYYASDGVKHTHYDINEALNQSNPRQLFTLGQLYVEMVCNDIISIYFTIDDPIRQGVLISFLISGDLDFSIKIKLLHALTYPDSKSKNLSNSVVDKKVITSLKAIAEVRNAFQHRLEFELAIAKVQRGSRFSFLQRKLSEYKDIETLMGDFKTEVKKVYSELNEITMKVKNLPRLRITKIESGRVHLKKINSSWRSQFQEKKV